MSAFRCQLLQADGSIIWRVIEAPSRADALASAAADGATVLDAVPDGPSLAGRIAAARPRIRQGRPASESDGIAAGPITPQGGGSARRWRAAAAVLLAALVLTGLGAAWLARRTEHETALLARRLAERAPPVSRAAVADALGGETLSATLARLAAALPEGAALHALGRDGDGRLEMEIDAADPEALRAALARDPALARLATAGETVIPDRGLRLRLVERR